VDLLYVALRHRMMGTPSYCQHPVMGVCYEARGGESADEAASPN
jgi:hypothetical protein